MTSRFETWFSIGRFVFHVSSADRRLACPLPGPLEDFFTSPRLADVEVVAEWSDTLAEPDGPPLFDSGGAWRLFRQGGEFLFVCRSSIGVAEPYMTARFDAAFTRGDVRVNRRYYCDLAADPAFPLEYPLDEVVMVHLLSRGAGVEIHGCGIVDQAGRAYVFAGQSGAGKSTIARLWSGRPEITVLSDERVVVRTDHDRITVWGTPFHGDAILASPRSGDLAGVFFLHHAPAHAAVPAEPSLAAAHLMSCAFVPFYDPQAIAKTFDAVDRAIRSVPCYDLWFAPDPSVLDCVLDLTAVLR